MKTIAEIMPGIIEYRHQMHRIPEIAGQEFKTQKAIRARLEGLGLEVLPPFIGTDTVAILRGGKGPGINVAIRADIDALKVTEETGLEFASEHPGMMHACGHDVHNSMLMGAAEILASRRDEFAGTIRFIWQPGEECQALGRKLVEAGVLENPKADIVTALHVNGGTPIGHFTTRPGVINGSSSHFKVVVHGKGGHSSRPDKSIDPVLATCAMVVEAQSVLARRLNPLKSAVLSICCIHAGALGNVIPSEAVIEGTARSFDPKDDDVLENTFREVIEGVAKAHGVTVEIEYLRNYAVSINDPNTADFARRVIQRTFGDDAYIELPQPSMGAEDFGYYMQQVPGVMVKLGIGKSSPGHSSTFKVPDEAMEYGIRYFVEFALAALRGEK